jgi:hypothetical protein
LFDRFEIAQFDLEKPDLRPALSVPAAKIYATGSPVLFHHRQSGVRLHPIKSGIWAENKSLFDPSLPAVHRGNYNSISSLFFLNNSARWGK